jgi:hypothetical protein
MQQCLRFLFSPAGVPTAGVPTAGVPTAGVPTAGVPTAGVPRWARTQACAYSRKQHLRSPEKTPIVSVQLKEAEHSRSKARFA